MGYLLINAHIRAWAMPNAGVYSTVGHISTAGLGVAKLFGIPVGLYLVLKVKWLGMRSPAIINGNYDICPGSAGTTADQFAASVPETWVSSTTTFGNGLHTFVPTVSALDLRNQNYGNNGLWFSQNLNFDINTNLPFGGLTPFNTVRINANTEEHVSVRLDDARFIHQIQTGVANFIFPCFGLCQTTAAAFSSGDGVICPTGQGTYQSGYTLQFGETLQWLSSSNLRLVTQSNTSGTFEYVAGQPQGAAWVQAVIRNRNTNCSRLLNQVAVWVGNPNTISLVGRVEGCNFIITPNSAGATLFDWEIDNPNIAFAS